MEAILRQQYLQSLGIVQYIPREKGGLAVEQQNHEEASGVGESQTSGKRRTVDIQRLMGLDETPDQAVPNTPIEKKSELPLSAKQPKREESQAEALNLTFSLWQASADLLVCSCSRDGFQPDRQQLQLLQNILIAIGLKAELPAAEIIEWPPFTGIVDPQGNDGVRDFLSTLLEARLAAKPVKHIILLGEAGDWIVTEGERATAKNGQAQLTLGPTALLIPSLSEMLVAPQSKRDAWGVLQFLSTRH